VVLIRRAKRLLADANREVFVKVVKRAFSQRRKMMLKLLKPDWPLEKLERTFVQLQISPQERGEKLSLEQFVAVAEMLASSNRRLASL
jgi:16S rRNA (adenine1518-N6/adenine1519-N6)-dimethyltransferase